MLFREVEEEEVAAAREEEEETREADEEEEMEEDAEEVEDYCVSNFASVQEREMLLEERDVSFAC